MGADITSNRAVNVAADGEIAVDAGATLTLAGVLSGSGALTKAGSGALAIAGDASGHTGGVVATGGLLAVDGVLGGPVSVAAGGRLGGNGSVAAVVNAGVVAPGASIGVLSVAGDYVGAGGALEIEAALGGDDSPADRLVIGGDASGVTTIRVRNLGGAGALTREGVRIVEVRGASDGAFVLAGDYMFRGQPAVIAGAYGYRLHRGGVTDPQDGHWYLRSSLADPAAGDGAGAALPLYQPGVPVYGSYPRALQALNGLPTLQQRAGNRVWSRAATSSGSGLWARIDGARQRVAPALPPPAARQTIDSWEVQAGADVLLAERDDGARLVGGVTAHYGRAFDSVSSVFGDGRIGAHGHGFGATLTWHDPSGFYADAQAKFSWFNSDLTSATLGVLARGVRGDGQALGLEIGRRFDPGGLLALTPQAQVTWGRVAFGRFADRMGVDVSRFRGDSLTTRAGLSVDYQKVWNGADGVRRAQAYGVANVSYDWLGGPETNVAGAVIRSRDDRLWGGVGFGGSLAWGDGDWTLYSEVTAETSLARFGRSYRFRGSAGFRGRF